jgi:glycosyltransferase involved in cell wall biosynthesis
MPEDKLSILIATYNEEGNIGKALEHIKEIFPTAQIIVVDDGSSDQTVSEAKAFESESVKIIPSLHSGKGGAVKTAIKMASGDIMVQIDADLQFPAEEIPVLLAPILEEKADIVFGSRYLRPSAIQPGSVSFIKRLASLFASGLVSLICLKRYTDVFAGMKAWKTQAIRDIDIRIDNFGYEAEIAIMARKKNYRIIEVPVSYRKRLAGESKIKIIRDIFIISKSIFQTAVFRH